MIRLEHVTAGYEGKVLFRELNAVFEQGSRIALMGPSGMGKTTLLRLITGLLKPEAGKVVYSGNCDRIAFLFQEDRLLPWETALKNVALVSDDNKARLWLERMEIEDADQYPNEMSGGMQRRVAIARALAVECPVLVMDEPFRGLDEELKTRIAPYMLAGSETMIFTTHDEREVALLDAQTVYIDQWIAM